MTVSVFNIILSVILLLIVPVFTGNELCGLLRLERTLSKSYVIGLTGIWAVCQIITVPLVLLKANFMIVVILLSIIIGIFCIHGIYKKRFVKIMLPTDTITQRLALCLLSGMGIIIGAVMAGCYGLVYGIAKKDWKLTIAMWACVVPNVIYYGISLFL